MKRGRREGRGPLERQARATLREVGRSMAGVERACAPALASAAEVVIACLESGGTVYFCGNGGSAADAQHLACELSGRYLMDRPAPRPAYSVLSNLMFEHVTGHRMAHWQNAVDRYLSASAVAHRATEEG